MNGFEKLIDTTRLQRFLSKIQTLLAQKQNTLTFDVSPTAGSTNPVTSGGIWSALNNYGTVSSLNYIVVETGTSGSVGLLNYIAIN